MMKDKTKKYLLNLLAKSRRQEGFTLIEMVVVIAIIVILMLLIVPNLINQKKKAETKTGDAFRITLQTQVELYRDEMKKDDLPVTFEKLAQKDYLTEDQKIKAEKNYTINEKGEVEAKNKEKS